jgi:pantoate--beta-alanine ligase
MKTVTTPREVRESTSAARSAGARIGFVPTMGALHAGHASLVRLARRRTGYVAASIFVNPKQFSPKEDLARYPRDVERDARLLEELECDLLFLPSEKDIYSPADRTRVSVDGLSDVLCGASRPGHFGGVTLVVAKLFNIVRPDEAYFGQKDAQQAVIIQRMAADLDFPVRIVLGATVREADGLAMSSRNAYLAPAARTEAPAMYRALCAAKRSIEQGERNLVPLMAAMRRGMEGAGFDVDYASIVEAATLRPVAAVEGTILMACAGTIGATRLIDNIALAVCGNRVEEVLLEFPEWSRYAEKR